MNICTSKGILIFSLSFLLASAVSAEPVSTQAEFFSPTGQEVTPSSYPTAETSRQILKTQDLVGVNKILHRRVMTPTDNQPVVRMNRDTYYSDAVVDVSQGATITLPEIPEGKYMSVQPVTEDHRIQPMIYDAGTFSLTTHTGTHLYLIVRFDSTFSEEEVTRFQDQMQISAKSNTIFTAEPVNRESFVAVENALKAKVADITKRDGINALSGMLTAPTDKSNEQFTQEKYEVGAAVGWGGAQLNDVIYEISGNYPADTCHQVTFKDPENKAFWSITVYNKSGFMFNDVANISSNTAAANEDGTYTVSFGCGQDAPNNLETSNDSDVFNLAIRHYQPSQAVSVDGYRIVPLVEAVAHNKTNQGDR